LNPKADEFSRKQISQNGEKGHQASGDSRFCSFTVKTNPRLGNAIPILGMNLKRDSAYFGKFLMNACVHPHQ